MTNENFKSDIKKCSRCGLCLKNCPIFNITHNENNTARGLICKLSGYFDQILLKKEIKNKLKICLNCTKCEQNCPSGVKTAQIFANYNARFCPSILNQKFILLLKLIPIKIIYILNIFKFKKNKKEKQQNKIVYFKGCMAHSQHKITFLDRKYQKANFDCCGIPYLASGDISNYNKAKAKNIKLIQNANKVIFDCSTCISSIKNYEELADKDKEKLIFYTDIIKKEQLKLKENSKYKNKIVTFHKPCHMTQEEFLKIEEILKSFKDITYKQLTNYDSCCGFGGSYFLFHPIIATKIALQKAKTIKKSKADLILTTCPSCVIGLRYNQIASFNYKKTMDLRDFIEQEFNI